MCLSELKPGECGRVAGLGPGSAVRQRMMDLGILPGAVLRLERVAPTGDPLWVRLRGYHVTLRRSEAAAIVLDGPAAG
jgi:ferrous iron transport protein A